eukprot:gb/GECH01012801.1/.p1 GENE.gb/GECH01012801.1/~~gb/GECH01012801.1/.p1  ORF type:complete len:288 (+),score=81.87 gb/GECH01012801.1/:1-864(+)
MSDPYAKYTEKPEKPYGSIVDIGFAEEMNPSFRRTMEDGKCMIDGFAGSDQDGFFAIYDGHGGTGAVNYVEEHLHNNLLIEIEDTEGDDEVTKGITRAYLRTDDNMKEANVGYSGTTAITALIKIESKEVDGKMVPVRKLYSSNCGDARTVLNRNGTALRLTHDHKGSDSAEAERIQEAGGFVAYGRVNGILAVSRALGDFEMKDFVTAEPYHKVEELNSNDTHLILACDGLWDVVEDQEAVDLVKDQEPQEAADLLMQTALKKRSTDNISIMVLKLRTDTPSADDE